MNRYHELPVEVVSAIQRVLEVKDAQPEDSLDTLSGFTPIATLNKLFPDEASLAHIEAVQEQLARDARAVQQEIEALEAELQIHQDPHKMQLIQEMISDLMGQMSRIREQASESEAVVRSITRDIQLLDLAKRNLTLSMTTLKRFQMLANALSQLEEHVKEKRYSEAAQSLSAVKELSSPFRTYLSNPRVSRIWARIQTLQGELRNLVDRDFDLLFIPDPAKPVKLSTIREACLVVDVIGEDFRTHLIDRYSAIELKEYRRIFRVSDEAGQLDNLNRRFAFFRRVLQTHDTERGIVFPPEWKVGQLLCAKFVDITRDDLSTLLDKTASSVLTVTVLLQSLQQALDFESFISRKYSCPLSDILKLLSISAGRPAKSLASPFEAHMNVFIDAQDKALADMLVPHRGKKARQSLNTSTTPSGSPIVLPSSTELFYFYQQSLEQCSKLFTGKPLYDLSILHRKWLRIYAEDVLLMALKKPANQTRRSMEARFDASELHNASHVLNTAEYCQVTATELEEKIIDKIDEDFKTKVNFQPERDLFLNVVSTAILALLKELEQACDGAFENMSRTIWTSIASVSGPSLYVADLTKNIEQVVETINPLIEQKKYLRNFYDKAAALILARFTNALVKSRPLSGTGAEQLLLDLQSIRECLTKLPGDSSASTSFGRGVTKSSSKLETLLKVIIPPTDPPEGFILNYTLLIGDASFSNFQKVLDLKGTPRAEQNNLLDTFVSITSTKDDLQATSFLTTLDMDPPANGSLTGVTSPSASRDNLPSLLAATHSSSSASDSIFGTLTPPPASGPPTGSDVSRSGFGEPTPKREVFSDLRRLVSFGLRRDTAPQ